ncbi:MAG: AMP-binding protein [Ilumatobacteraceae bacterium]
MSSGQWTGVTLAERIDVHARRQPGSTAVVDSRGNRRVSFARLHDDVDSLGRELRAAGVRAGDVVSIQLPNCYEAVVFAAATQALGGVINPLLPSYRAREIGHVYATARPALHVTTRDGLSHMADAADAVDHRPVQVVIEPGSERSQGEWLGGATTATLGSSADPIDPTPIGERVSEVIFTSGTEATPKAVMHTENTANFSVRVAHQWLGLDSTDSVWMPSPVGHSTGFNYGVRFALYHGMKLVLQDAWNASEAVRLLEAERCTYTLAATTFLQDLVRLATERRVDLSFLRAFGCGGAPVPEALVEAAERVGITVLRLYGATEFLVATWNTARATAAQRGATDGNALTGVEVTVRDEVGRDCEVGQPGEVVVRGPNTCVGFFADPDRTAATFDSDGWCRSGDLGVFDADGYLSIVGRKKDMIIRGGLNIAPREIEDALVAFPEVWQAAVVGVAHERLGERACACVVLQPGSSIDLVTVTERLTEQGFAKYKLPESLQVFDQFPMTASGKVQKHELRAMLAGDHV